MEDDKGIEKDKKEFSFYCLLIVKQVEIKPETSECLPWFDCE